ncbi:MAG: cytochrome C oxidase subunit IV family protein [Verrucomicrobiota bacterium]
MAEKGTVAEHNEAHEREHLLHHMKIYRNVLYGLLVGTFLTVAAYWWLDIGGKGIGAWDIALGLLIASAKASLVLLFFMHLNNEKRLVYIVLVFAVIFVIGLFVLSLGAYYNKIEY